MGQEGEGRGGWVSLIISLDGLPASVIYMYIYVYIYICVYPRIKFQKDPRYSLTSWLVELMNTSAVGWLTIFDFLFVCLVVVVCDGVCCCCCCCCCCVGVCACVRACG